MNLLRKIIKFFIGLGLLSILFIFFGSFFIKKKVVQLVNNRNITTASAIYSRPLPLNKDFDIEKYKLKERLLRLSYQFKNSTPQNPGEVFWDKNQISIFLRGFNADNKLQQNAELVRLELSPTYKIQSISDLKFQNPLNQVFLEPEVLSLLGDNATRASIQKSLKDFPKPLINSVLAIEDERFYSHFGVDPVGLLRAITVNLSQGQLVQGGSTITQQLAKNLFFSSERTISRKILELFTAIALEFAFKKDEILELYLNEVYLGQEGNIAIHGFAEAEKSFFGHDISQINIAEAATLAGIIKAPSSYSPRRYPKRALKRKKVVLDKMLELHYISDKEYDQALGTKLITKEATHTKRIAPYFSDYIRKILPEIIPGEDSTTEKIQVITGIDVDYQKCAETAVELGLKKLRTAFPRLNVAGKEPLQAALISVSPTDGTIISWVGGRDYGENQFDRISQSSRQPGSAFKPFVYLTALDKDLNSYKVARTTSLLMDEPVSIQLENGQIWEPKDFDDEYRGEVTVREALTHSLNIPTIELATKVGIDKIARTAERYGFGKNLPQVPSLALGAGDVSPFALARAYTALANGGILIDLRPISSITLEGKTEPIYQSKLNFEQASSEQPVYILTTILQDVINRGTGNSIRRLGYTGTAAGKTGTSNDTRDAWFAGFTPHNLTIVWVGFDDNRETKLTGGQAAAPIWAEFEKCIAPMEPQLDFIPPEGIVFRNIDKTTGLIATSYCPREYVIKEVFIQGTEPVTECDH